MIGDTGRIGQLLFPSIGVGYVVGSSMWQISLNIYFLVGCFLLSIASTLATSHSELYAGEMEVEDLSDGTKRYTLSLDMDPRMWKDKDRLIFSVEDSRN